MSSLKYLKEALTYCPMTGVLRWRADRPRAHYKNPGAYASYMSNVANKAAGRPKDNGYLYFSIGGKNLHVHRVAYAMHHGIELCDLPDEIDHRNLKRTDNKISNLRGSTSSNNKHNTRKRSHNTSGYKGVTWDKSRQLWKAGICVNRKFKNIGRFTTPEAAAAAYDQASRDLHGEFSNNNENSD